MSRIQNALPAWQEPVRGGFPDPSFFSLSGLEQMRAFLHGDILPSPLTRLVGLRLTQVGSGSATMTLRLTPWLQLPDGSLDVCVLAGVALLAATRTVAPQAIEARASTMSINRLRPFTLESESAVARARVVNSGRAFTFSEVQVEDGLGRLLAIATGSFLLRPMEPTPPPAPSTLPAVPEQQFATPDPILRSLPHDLFPAQVYGEWEGLSIMERILARDSGLIPYHQLTGFGLVELKRGLCVAEMPATDWVGDIQRRVVDAGVLAFLAGHAMSAAVYTVTPAGRRVGVLDQGMSFVRGAKLDGRNVNVRAPVTHEGDGVVVTSAEVTDSDGNQIALGHQTSVILDKSLRTTRRGEPERVLGTLLFVDIVGSTELAQQLGDTAWREKLESFSELVRSELTNYRGRRVKETGDGFLASFDAAARAVRCAMAIRAGVRRLGLEIYAGLHLGDYELLGTDVGGIAVNIASRVESLAKAGEILVSGTVRDASAGSGLVFSDRGSHSLKGVGGEWHLFAVEGQ